MQIEAQPTTSTTAEAAAAKELALWISVGRAEARLLLEENGKLREALVHARQCIDADDVIGAHAIITAVLGEKE